MSNPVALLVAAVGAFSLGVGFAVVLGARHAADFVMSGLALVGACAICALLVLVAS